VPDLTLQTNRNANFRSFVVKKLGIFAALVAVSTVLTLLAVRRDDAAVAPVAQDAAMPAKETAKAIVPDDGCKLAGAIPDCEAVMARLRSGGTYGDSDTGDAKVLLFDPEPVSRHEVANDDGSEARDRIHAAETADRIKRANSSNAAQLAQYGRDIAARRYASERSNAIDAMNRRRPYRN
jgi:hypothetical protein